MKVTSNKKVTKSNKQWTLNIKKVIYNSKKSKKKN